jgi:hypothetical protein
MVAELVRGNEEHSVNRVFWGECLDVAEAFGWNPAGTLPIEQMPAGKSEAQLESEWDNTYLLSNRRVTDLDAHALGVALYRAVSVVEAGSDMTDQQKEALARFESGAAEIVGGRQGFLARLEAKGRTSAEDLVLLRTLLGPGPGIVEELKEIADFVSRGGFEIA